MLISIVNQSSLVKDADVETMCAAIQKQMVLQVAPAWNQLPPTIHFYSSASAAPGYSWVVYVIDNDTSIPGALGFHTETNDKIDGYIMCQPILSNGGTTMAFDPANPGQYTVSGTLSHECIEMFGNRFCGDVADNGSVSWAKELCDPVEQVGYGVNGVSVSDFVFPSFFNPNATLPQNAPYNFLNSLTAPFTILPGGYAIQRTGGPGTETQVFGEAMPQWRRDMKTGKFSRASKRSV